MIKRFFLIIGLVLNAQFSFAQVDYSAEWEDFYSYNNVQDFAFDDNKIYALSENAIFVYDESRDSYEKYSSVNGLLGERASGFFYSEQLQDIIVGYENGMIEVIDRNFNIKRFYDIFNFSLVTNKRINDIVGYGDNAYIATPFGIVNFDLEKGVFGETYFIGDNSSEVFVNEMIIENGIIYAATEQGFYTADINDLNLVDFNNWTNHDLTLSPYSDVVAYNGKIYVSGASSLYEFDFLNGFTSVKMYTTNISELKATDEYLCIALERNAEILDENLLLVKEVYPISDSKVNGAIAYGNDIYIATESSGVVKAYVNSTAKEEIHPQGPALNGFFSMNVNTLGDLWVVYGGHDRSYVPLGNAKGYSIFSDGEWINTEYDPNYPGNDLVSVAFDPNNPNKAYMGSWSGSSSTAPSAPIGGILITEGDQPIEMLTSRNSPLEDITPNSAYTTTRVNGIAFDRDGNRWMTNSTVDNMLKVEKANGDWKGVNLISLITNSARGLNKLVIDKSGHIWIGTLRNGALVYDGKTDRESQDELQGKKRALTTQVNSGSLPDPNVRAIASDASNRIWIGTARGLVMYSDGSRIFDSNIYDADPVIIVDEEGVAQRLLGELPVNVITVDGADNKWFGTDRGGVIHTSPNGKETLNLFNKENSPLPSDNILDIKIDDNTGKVYIATDLGMVAFNSDIAGYGDSLGEVYAYPNPCTKNHNQVTIAGRYGNNMPENTNVKILDSAGNLVFETNTKQGQNLNGGKVVWNKRNLAGRKVASGIYIVLLTTKDGSETSTTKIAIIN